MARTMSPDEYQELGKRYYKHKQYEKAIDAFTEAIEASVCPTVDLFDYRAAAYDKLQDFNSALKDGRQMIRLDKKDVKGYLRTGSMLQKINKPDKAIEIYAYGMKYVPVDNKGFQYLQQLHNKLTRLLSPAKAVDPFTILPVELVEMVISYLTFRNMVNCLRVCKNWKNYLIRRPKIWVDVDLSGARREVSRKFVANAVRYAEGRTNRLTVHRFRHLDVLRNIATTCKSLSYIEFISGGLMSDTIIEMAQCASNLKQLVLHTAMTVDTITQILRFRPTLEHAEFRSVIGGDSAGSWKGPFPRLRTLTLLRSSKLHQTSFALLQPLLKQSPGLKHLTLGEWDGGRDNLSSDAFDFRHLPLTQLDLHNCGFYIWPQLPSTLQQLILQPRTTLAIPNGRSNGTINSQFGYLNAENCYLPELSHLTLSNCAGINADFLSALFDTRSHDEFGPIFNITDFSTVSRLQHISIGGCTCQQRDGDNLFGVNGILTASPRILSGELQSLSHETLSTLDTPTPFLGYQHRSLTTFRDVSEHQITDTALSSLLSHTTSLTCINLSQTKITGAGVKTLVDSLANLACLDLDDCDRISSRDIVEYAEKRGVRVSMRMAGMGAGKKKKIMDWDHFR